MRKEFFKRVRHHILELSEEMPLLVAIEEVLVIHKKPWEWLDDMPSQSATPKLFLEWWHEVSS